MANPPAAQTSKPLSKDNKVHHHKKKNNEKTKIELKEEIRAMLEAESANLKKEMALAAKL